MNPEQDPAPIIVAAAPFEKLARKIVVGIIGMTVLVIGIALIVLPGPAFVVIPIGLGILATEFLWARQILQRFKKAYDRVRNKPTGP